uniref:Serine/threonine-protein kinase 11-interacting protein n=1 Tax=Nothobranchius korthausae TaxID=1143690 RepID=A0A1A8EVY9_9TELE
MAVSNPGQSPLVHSLATLLRDCGDVVLDGSSTLTLPAANLQQLTRLFEQHLLPRSQQHGFLALPSHPADTTSLLQLQFLFDVLQKTVSLKLINPPGVSLEAGVKIFPFKSLKYLELQRVPPSLLEGLRGVYSQLEVFICTKSLSSLEELLSLCGGDLSSALPWLELHTLNFSYNSIVRLDQSLGLLNVLRCLDLSHNKIQDCSEFLKPLSELGLLNLGYNHLQRAPILGPSARAKLHTLILRNNELETINGVEQLSSLQHLDLAYNLLLEHSQLSPLSLLHGLVTLNLEGNPLSFQKTHRTCTVQHLSRKAVSLSLRLDGVALSSSELSVLPKTSQPIHQFQSLLPPVSVPSERSYQDVSSGAGELSDSMSFGEIRVSHLRKRKSRSKAKVRTASISEPSDTDHEPRRVSSTQDIVLPHQQEIERMSSFRDQLGEDWLRYQHYLDQSEPADSETLSNGLSASTTCPPVEPLTSSLLDVQVVHPPPVVASETKYVDLDKDSTLQWFSQSSQQAATTSMVDGLVVKQEVELSLPSGPDSPRCEEAASGDGNQEEEEGLGVDLCHPLLVGVLPDGEERGSEALEKKTEVFLCVKQGLLLEVDVQRGQERCRLELDSLSRVETAEATWTRGDTEDPFPAVELYFDYISKAKRRRCYVLLDDDPQQTVQALTDILTRVVEENQLRDSKLVPCCVRLQCLRCRSEFTPQGEDDDDVGARLTFPKGEEERSREGLMDTSFDNDSKGRIHVCPKCGSDHVIQVVEQTPPYSSTPDGKEMYLDITVNNHNEHDDTDGKSYSPVLETATTSEEQTFVTAQGSSFFIGDAPGDTSSLYSTDFHSKEDLAGSYHYTATGETPPPVDPTGPSTPNDDLDLLSEDYEAVDHRLKLFLEVEVFEEDEELHSFLKMSAVTFGEMGEHHLWPLVCEDIQADVEDGQLQFFYLLAFVLQDIWVPLTVLATRETLYLLEEDHQWRRTISSVTEKEACSGSFTIFETLPISCVSSILLWPVDQCRMDFKLYDETVKQEKTWCVRSESSELLQGLLAWVRSQWEAMFGVKLHTSLQERAT